MMKWICYLIVFGIVMAGCQSKPVKGTAAMDQEEQAIREFFDKWMRATKEGDPDLANTLIADDAIFLVPWAGQMDKPSFVAGATADDPNINFELDCRIQEIKIMGEYAWLVTTIELSMTDRRTNEQRLMKGDGLTVLNKRDGRWVTVREANTMVPVDQN